MKRATTLLLALLMAVSFAACGSGGTGAPASKTPDPAATNQSQADKTPEELPTVVWKFTNSSNYEPGSATWPTEIFKEFQEAVREKIGINLEFQGWADNQAFELALAGGDLPDMLTVQRDYTSALLKGNHILPMDDYLDLAPNFQAASKVRTESMREYYSKNNDGKLYFWTPYVGLERVGSSWWNGMNIRWDYYKELGYPEVKNEDDYLAVLKQAVDRHPETEDGKKVYGCATFSDGTLWGWWIRGCMYGYSNISDAYSLDIRDKANDIINNLTNLDSPVWRDVRFYYKANQMGLFDPDSLTMKGDDLGAKATNGQLVSTNCTWYAGQLRENEAAKNPDSLAEFAVLPVEGQYNWGNAEFGIGWSFFHGISSKTKYPEQIMKLIDYLNTPEGARMAYMGKQGRVWDIVDGKPKVKPEAIEIAAKGGNEAMLYKNGIQSLAVGLSGSVMCADGGPADLWQDPDIWALTLTPASRDFCAHYGVQVPSQAAEKLIDEGKAYDKRMQNGDLITLLPPTPQDISRIDSKCVDIMVKAIPRLVLAKNQAEFDAEQKKTLEAFQGADIQTSIDWWKAQEQSIKEFLNTVE